MDLIPKVGGLYRFRAWENREITHEIYLYSEPTRKVNWTNLFKTMAQGIPAISPTVVGQLQRKSIVTILEADNDSGMVKVIEANTGVVGWLNWYGPSWKEVVT